MEKLSVHTNEKIKAVIFDFDGTLADTFETVYRISRNLAKRFHIPKKYEHPMLYYRNRNPVQIIKEMKVPLFRLPWIISHVQSELHKEIQNARPVEKIRDILETLHKKGYRIIALSSNTKENIQKYFKYHKWDKMFHSTYPGISLFGKAHKLKKMLRRENLKKDEVLYVGDEVRDIKACKRARIKIAAVTWGYNLRDFLKQHKPDFLVDKPQELLKLILQNRQDFK